MHQGHWIRLQYKAISTWRPKINIDSPLHSLFLYISLSLSFSTSPACVFHPCSSSYSPLHPHHSSLMIITGKQEAAIFSPLFFSLALYIIHLAHLRQSFYCSSQAFCVSSMIKVMSTGLSSSLLLSTSFFFTLPDAFATTCVTCVTFFASQLVSAWIASSCSSHC